MYLVCRFDSFDNERSLALHRILAAQASTLTFERPKDFDLKQYNDDGRFGYGDGERIRLSFRIEKDAELHLLESPLSVLAFVEPNEDKAFRRFQAVQDRTALPLK